MCYAKPGPRCSSHARTDLKNAQVAMASAQSLMDAAHTVAQTEASPKTRAHNRRDYERLVDEFCRAKDAFIAAREAYEATPEGIAGLKDDLAARRYELGSTHIDTDQQYQDLMYRLRIGQSVRARQLAAFKKQHGDTASAPEGVVEDEAEAAAPPPPCTCIDYHYEGTCGHLEEHVETAPRSHLFPSNTGGRGPHARPASERSTGPQPGSEHTGSPLVDGPLLGGLEQPDPGPARRRSLISRLFTG